MSNGSVIRCASCPNVCFLSLLHTDGAGCGVAVGTGLQFLAEIADAVGIGGGLVLVDDVDVGGVGVGIEDGPVGFVVRVK